MKKIGWVLVAAGVGLSIYNSSSSTTSLFTSIDNELPGGLTVSVLLIIAGVGIVFFG